MNELRVNCLLYADDQVMLSSSAEELQEMVTIMNEALMEKGVKFMSPKRKYWCLNETKEWLGVKFLLT
jgi:hypothetical protein